MLIHKSDKSQFGCTTKVASVIKQYISLTLTDVPQIVAENILRRKEQ